ncbi:glycosyltransferase family 4 protein [Patescibacteria group bacterium AH-259-L05]|nr:glycosyltransferase family 4 protein [Patescibacteria group bacterium AH-259-L05]
MKIGIYPSALKSSGGIYQYTLTLLDALKKNFSNELWIFGFHNKTKKAGKKEKKGAGLKKVVKYFLLKLHLFSLLTLIYRVILRSEIKKINKNADLFFFPCVDPLAFLVNISTVVAIHDVQHRFNPQLPESSRHGEWEWREYLHSRTCQTAYRILVNSEVSRDDIIDIYHVPVRKIIILPYIAPTYLKLEVSKQEKNDISKKYNLPSKFIFYPANFWPLKNHYNLLRALALLKEQNIIVPLVLTGNKQEKWGEYDRVTSLIKAENLREQVFYLGYIAARELNIIYKLTTALVYPSFLGSANIPTSEAFYLGCPVLVSDIRGCREQVGNAGLLFDPSRPNDIAEKIYAIWTNEKLRSTLRQRGFDRMKGLTKVNFERKISDIINEFDKEVL